MENQDLDYMPSPSPTNNEQKRKHVMTLGEWKISADKEPWDHDGMNLSSKFYEFHIAAKKRVRCWRVQIADFLGPNGGFNKGNAVDIHSTIDKTCQPAYDIS